MTTLLSNPRAMIGVFILLALVLTAIFAPQLSPYEPDRIVARRDLPPSSEHILGTTSLGQDVFSQMIYGTRVSLTVGFATGTLVVLIAMTIGITSGLVGGYVDNVVSMIVNVVLVLPQLPLIIVIASWAQDTGPITIILVLAATGWAFGARVLRAQALALRNSWT
ncbi:MAG: ABC transporter permease, partial [Anaerolineae bacterium]|nr:ABC transporter permease [Anaerolineae bacterium]